MTKLVFRSIFTPTTHQALRSQVVWKLLGMERVLWMQPWRLSLDSQANQTLMPSLKQHETLISTLASTPSLSGS
jgi:hypothetical protein